MLAENGAGAAAAAAMLVGGWSRLDPARSALAAIARASGQGIVLGDCYIGKEKGPGEKRPGLIQGLTVA